MQKNLVNGRPHSLSAMMNGSQCLWEEAISINMRTEISSDNIKQRDKHENKSFHASISRLFQNVGTVKMREYCRNTEVVIALLNGYDALSDEDKEALPTFDWDYVPLFFCTCLEPDESLNTLSLKLDWQESLSAAVNASVSEYNEKKNEDAGAPSMS